MNALFSQSTGTSRISLSVTNYSELIQCQELASTYKNDLVADELVSELSQFHHYVVIRILPVWLRHWEQLSSMCCWYDSSGLAASNAMNPVIGPSAETVVAHLDAAPGATVLDAARVRVAVRAGANGASSLVATAGAMFRQKW